MKRIINVFLLLIVALNNINAQLLVDNNGNVRVKNANGSTIASDFAINTRGDSTISSYLLSDKGSQEKTLYVKKEGLVTTSSNNMQGIFSTVKQPLTSMRKAYGLYSQAYKETGQDTDCGRSFGVYGIAGNSTSGYNYGVFGTLYGSHYGAGVYGSSESLDGGIDVPGRLAGFFRGNVKSTNTMSASAFIVSSDYRLKENIKSIETGSADGLMKLNVVKYNLKQRTVNASDTAKVPINYYTEDDDLLKKEHFGLIAQELQDIYPDLVYEGEDGYLSVNYMEIIPLLIQSIQSLKEEVEILKTNKKTSKLVTSSNQIEKEISTISKISASDNVVSITCVISNPVKNARIIIYDIKGNEYYSNPVKERGHMQLQIKDLALNDGIFVCSLCIDDEVDTRRFYYGK